METKFKVGDKVRPKNEELYLLYYPGTFIINSVRICPDSNYYDIISELNGAKSYYWREDRLELVPPEPEFKVGDRVVTMYGTYTIPPSHGEGLNTLAKLIHKNNEKWWIDLETGQRIERNVGELLMLITSEVAEAMEGHRKDLMDDKLPHRKMLEVELADALIRILDFAGGFNLDIGGAVVEKINYNLTREDHKVEARKSINGKKY